MLCGKKTSWMLSVGWPQKSSRQSSTLCPCWLSHPSHAHYISLKSFTVIHAFEFALYLMGISLFLKARGLLDLPITKSRNFSVPLIFAPTRRVILCLLFFPPVHHSPWNSWSCLEAIARRVQSCPGWRCRLQRTAWVRAKEPVVAIQEGIVNSPLQFHPALSWMWCRATFWNCPANRRWQWSLECASTLF